MKRHTRLAVLMVGLGLVQSVMAYEPNKTYHFTVVHTNDTHGRFWHNHQGEYGFPAQKTVIDGIREEVSKQGGSLLVLHAGDVNTGVPESDLLNARPDIEAMNQIGYEAMAVGNHEFDFPRPVLEMQKQWANFPFLSANVVDKATGKPLAKPYVILNKNGLKFAIVGLTTEETATAGNPLYVDSVKFNNVWQSAYATLRQINKKNQADVKIALTHLGYYHDERFNPATSDVALAQKLPKKSFDMIIGGHSHTTVCMENGLLKQDFQAGDSCQPDFKNGTWIMQAGEWGKYVGRADFTFKNGKTTLLRYQLIPINLKKKQKDEQGNESLQFYTQEIVPDKPLSNYLQVYQEQGAKKLSEPVARANGMFDGKRENVRSNQSALGHLITRAQKERVKADLAIINGGGIRASLPDGVISYKDVLTVHPFGNIVSYVDLTGAELLDYLGKIAQHPKSAGNYAQFSADVSMRINQTAKTISDVKIGGKPIIATQTYRLAFTDFLARGGDGYPDMHKHPTYLEMGFADADVLKGFLQQHQTVNVSDFEPKGEIIYE